MVADALVGAAGTAAMVPRLFVVRAVTPETSDTVTVALDPADGRATPFEPGQFTMIGAPGFPDVPISISGDPSEPTTLVHTVRAVGAATAALERAQVGDTVLVRGPYGQGWQACDAAGADVLIVAGGIGLAPLRPVLYDVVAHRDRFRRVFLVHGGRTPPQLLYRAQLEEWRDRGLLDLVLTADAADRGWREHVGLVTTALPRHELDPASTFAFLCGPEIMMRLTADELCRRGMPMRQIRLSMERNMKCGVGLCGHCQLREHFVCTDGPVFDYGKLHELLTTSEL